MEYDLDRLHYACSVDQLPRSYGKTLATCFQLLGYLQLGTKNSDSNFTHIAVGCLDPQHCLNFMDTCRMVLEDHGFEIIAARRQGYVYIWQVVDMGLYAEPSSDGWSDVPQQTITFLPSCRKDDWQIGQPPFLWLEDKLGY
jgi:hypothetical protein